MQPFTYRDIEDNFNEAISLSDFFDFDMTNIVNWRHEMLHLIKILGKFYNDEKKKRKGKKTKKI